MIKDQTFTPEQIETIQIKMIALLYYVKKHDARPLPECLQKN